ncbi:MAG: methyl-accepting chemotaxis protein [Pseudomonadota bacterium]
MKISTRLLIAFGGATAMVAAIAAVAALQVRTLARQLGTAQALQAGQEAVWLVVAMALVGAVGGIVIAAWLMRSLWVDLGAEPRALAAYARRVADGDLAPAEHTAARGVLADLERMRAQLVELVAAVHARSGVVAATSASMSSDGAELGRLTEAHAAELRAAADGMRALASAAQSSADSAQQSILQTEQACAAAAAGQDEIREVVAAMGAITAGARRVDDIAGLIDGLASQTSVLALNAAAAAARAGATGREFAVVAQEVRALAQRSAGAAAEVKQLVGISAELAGKGEAQVRRTGDAVQQIVAIVRAVATYAQAIGDNSSAQVGAALRLSAALSDIDGSLRGSASLAARNAGTAADLDRQATALLHAVAAFRLPGANQPAEEALGAPVHAS